MERLGHSLSIIFSHEVPDAATPTSILTAVPTQTPTPISNPSTSRGLQH